MTDRIKQGIRDHGLVSAIHPDSNRRVISAAKRALDDQAKIVPQAATTIRQPVLFNWLASAGMSIRAPRAGTITLVAVHSDTAPSTGQLIYRMYQTTPTSGKTLIYTGYCPSGTKIYEERVSLPILAGSWLWVDVQSTGSASGVSISASMNVG